MKFREKTKIRRTIIPAAAFEANSFWGLDTQLKIWIGKTVKGSKMLSGRNAIKVRAPMVIKGALSPRALDIARNKAREDPRHSRG